MAAEQTSIMEGATTDTLKSYEDSANVPSPWYKLPTEIRLLIYEYCLCETRIWETDGQWNNIYHKRRLESMFHKVPCKEPLLGICHETRETALKHGFFLGPSQGQPGAYVRKHDILFLNSQLLFINNFFGTADEMTRDLLDSLDAAENVAIEWMNIEPVTAHLYWYLGKLLPKVKKVHLVIPGVRTCFPNGIRRGLSEPTFLKSQPAEITPIPNHYILPGFTKKGEGHQTRDGTLETSGEYIAELVRTMFNRSQGHVVEVEVSFLQRTKLLMSPTNGLYYLVYGPGTSQEKFMTTDEYNAMVSQQV